MAIEVNDVRDLAGWALSKACQGWRDERTCYDKDTKLPLELPHPGCIQAQRAHDIMAKLDRYEGPEVLGWLVDETELDSRIW